MPVIALLRRGEPGLLPPPVEGFEERLSPAERQLLGQVHACSVVGTPDMVRAGVDAFVTRTGVDEVIITGHIHDHGARLRSFQIAAEQLLLVSA